ncbi:hypothetical protein CHS0354_006383, partial [Potamilus streckersoni]
MVKFQVTSAYVRVYTLDWIWGWGGIRKPQGTPPPFKCADNGSIDIKEKVYWAIIVIQNVMPYHSSLE